MYFFKKMKNKFAKKCPSHDAMLFPKEESLDEKLDLLLKNREMISFYLFKRNELRSIYKSEYEDLMIVVYCFEKELKVRLYRGYQGVVEFHYHVAFEKFVYFSSGRFREMPATDTALYRFMMFLITRNWKEMGNAYKVEAKIEEKEEYVSLKDDILVKKEKIENDIKKLVYVGKDYLSLEEMHFLIRMKTVVLKEILLTYDALQPEMRQEYEAEIIHRFEKVFEEIKTISIKVEERKVFELEKRLRIMDKMIQ